MLRWTSFIYLLVLYQYSIQQPITNDGENGRQPRQLAMGECCPCPGSSPSFDQQSAASFRQGMLDTAQGVDDCPCRHRASDTEGASSILFPNTMRAAGTFLKPIDKKEDVKPLLHPEVDLASSVLETLREATNEEYREALAREAVRDAVKIVGLSDSTFRDTTPEESRSIVTIIMNPNEDFEDDTIPQASHLQESRCIHAALGSARSSLGELKVLPKPPLVNEIFSMAKARHPSLLNRNYMDMDNNVGASNIQEHVVNVDEELSNSRDAGLRTRVPLFKLYPKSQSINNNDDDCNERNRDLKSPLIFNTVKYPLGSSLFQNIKNKKIGQLPTNTRLESSLFGNKNNRVGNNDLGILPNKVKDSESGNTIIKEIPSFRKPTLKNILDKSRPFNLKQLLKLKDVELIPSDQRNKATAVVHPTLMSHTSNRKNNAVITSLRDRNQVDLLSNTENNNLNSKMIPPKENCCMETEEKETRNIPPLNKKPLNSELEIFDSISNPSNTIFSVDNGQTSGDSRNDETPNIDSNKLILPMTTREVESRTGIDIDEPKASNKDSEIDELKNSKTTSASENPESDVNENDCDTDKKHASLEFDEQEIGCESDEKESSWTTNDNDNNSRLSCTNNIKDNLETKEQRVLTEEKDMVPEESSIREAIENIEDYAVETTTTKYRLLKPLPLDKTLLSIKEKVQSTLDNLKNINIDIKDISEQNKSNARILLNDDNETNLFDKNVEPDCVIDNSEQLRTTLKPTIYDGDTEKDNKSCDFVTTQELQQISDALLQEEVTFNTKNPKCGDKGKASEDSTEKNENYENYDSESSADTQHVALILPEQEDNINSDANLDNMTNLCQGNLSMSRPAHKIYPTTTDGDKTVVTEMDADASDIFINKLSQKIIPLANTLKYPLVVDNIQQIPLANDPLNLLKSPLPDVRDILKLAPLPSLDDIKLKISNLFDTSERDAQKEHCMSTSPSEFKSSIATDASTANFQIKQPSIRSRSRENLNLDIFQLKPQSNLKTSIFDWDSLKPKLPSITNTDGILGSRLPLFPNDVYAAPKLSEVFDDIVEKFPNIDDLRDRMRSNTQELLNTPSILENFNEKLDLSDLKYHTENSVNNIKQKLKAVGNDFNLRSPMKNSHNFFDTLAEKHEDLSDKLRAVHIDFNDRLESMRNSLIKPTYLNNDRRKSNTQSFSDSMNKDRPLLFKSRISPQVSNTKESLFKPETQRKVKPITSQYIDQRKFKMPAAASMPIPETVEVPKLKVKSMKSATPTTKDPSIFKSSITEPPPARSSTIFAKQAIKNLQNANRQLGGKQVNPFKNSKVTVSFSTTPRPLHSLTLKPQLTSTVAPISSLKSTAREKTISDTSRNNGNNRTPQIFKDSNGALSESKSLAILAPEANIDERVRPDLDKKNMLEDSRNSYPLKSWPQVTDSSFLTKVKEALNARLPKVKKLEDEAKNDSKIEDDSTDDALRSASENLEIIRKDPLQENVSYKCRMVCTRE